MWEWARLGSRPWDRCVSADQLGRPATPHPLTCPNQRGPSCSCLLNLKSGWVPLGRKQCIPVGRGPASCRGLQFPPCRWWGNGARQRLGPWDDGALFLRPLGIVSRLLGEQVGRVWSEGPVP